LKIAWRILRSNWCAVNRIVIGVVKRLDLLLWEGDTEIGGFAPRKNVLKIDFENTGC